MNLYVYIIYSISKEKYYVGYTHDLNLCLTQRNDDWTKSTKVGNISSMNFDKTISIIST